MKTHNRRTLPVVALALAVALIVSACGAGDSLPSADGDLLPPTPIRIVSGSPGGDAATAGPRAILEAEDGGEGGVALDMGMIAPWYVYEYTVGDMPALPTTANGWTYPAGVAPDLARLRAIAAALGVPGEPVQRPADMGGGWIIGPEDGSAASLWVSADGQLSWWYNAAYAMTAVDTGCARPIESTPPDQAGGETDAGAGVDGTSAGGEDVIVHDETSGTTPIDECVFEEPEPPTGILSAGQAEAAAVELITRMGEDPSRFEFQVYADEWYASVSALERLGEATSPSGWYFGFGAEGRLDYAGGVLADPTEVGPYPLVDLDTAIARLRDGYMGWIMPLADDTPALGALDLLCEEGAECAPPEPEPIQVTLTDFRLDLWWAWDSDGTIWLLPAFTFLDADGNGYTVPAVTDDYLIVDDVAVEPPVDDPAPPADGVIDEPVIAEDDAAALIGMSEDEALATIEELGWTARVVSRDGEAFAVTDDYRLDRVNLTIDAGTVTEVTIG